MQTNNLTEEAVEFSKWSLENVTNYKKSTGIISFGNVRGSSNVKVMKLVVPSTENNQAYQLFMIAEKL